MAGMDRSVPRPAALLATTWLALAASSPGQLIAEEGFDYPEGTNAAGQSGGSGWGEPWQHELGTVPFGTLEPGFVHGDGTTALPIAGASRLRVMGVAFKDQGLFRRLDTAAAPPET